MKLVSTRLSEGQHLLGVLAEAYTRALNVTQVDQQELIRTEFTRLRAEWDQLNISLNSTLSKLKVRPQFLVSFFLFFVLSLFSFFFSRKWVAQDG